jgi:hypothetical protein
MFPKLKHVGFYSILYIYLFDRNSNFVRESRAVIGWWQVGGFRDPPVPRVFVFWVNFSTVGFSM